MNVCARMRQCHWAGSWETEGKKRFLPTASQILHSNHFPCWRVRGAFPIDSTLTSGSLGTAEYTEPQESRHLAFEASRSLTNPEVQSYPLRQKKTLGGSAR